MFIEVIDMATGRQVIVNLEEVATIYPMPGAFGGKPYTVLCMGEEEEITTKAPYASIKAAIAEGCGGITLIPDGA